MHLHIRALFSVEVLHASNMVMYLNIYNRIVLNFYLRTASYAYELKHKCIHIQVTCDFAVLTSPHGGTETQMNMCCFS